MHRKRGEHKARSKTLHLAVESRSLTIDTLLYFAGQYGNAFEFCRTLEHHACGQVYLDGPTVLILWSWDNGGIIYRATWAEITRNISNIYPSEAWSLALAIICARGLLYLEDVTFRIIPGLFVSHQSSKLDAVPSMYIGTTAQLKKHRLSSLIWLLLSGIQKRFWFLWQQL